MANIIDYEKCIGCNLCYERCPESVYDLDDAGRVYVRREEECWLCGSCQMDCPADALKVKFDLNVAPLFFFKEPQ
ncbi:MAG: ferredoxin family protein [Clostridiales Family XIII bacterium]|jgi:NAD-dependent dihydropyrimidine dehydrogenase PreA subunit|nr:ferredoxin family protein [Clostridiales Family XIII bacterium]